MKYTLTLVLHCLFVSLFSSQTINIQWDGSKIIDYGNKNITVPFFKNEGFAYEDGSVFFRLSEKNSGVSQKVENYKNTIHYSSLF